MRQNKKDKYTNIHTFVIGVGAIEIIYEAVAPEVKTSLVVMFTQTTHTDTQTHMLTLIHMHKT